MVLSDSNLWSRRSKYMNVFELQLLRRLVVSLHYLFDGLQKGTGAQGRPSRSFSPVNAASLNIAFVATCIVTRITVAPSRFSVSNTSRLVKLLSFKETILS